MSDGEMNVGKLAGAIHSLEEVAKENKCGVAVVCYSTNDRSCGAVMWKISISEIEVGLIALLNRAGYSVVEFASDLVKAYLSGDVEKIRLASLGGN